MQVELVRCKTKDGLRLDGALVPGVAGVTSAGIDGMLLLHGVGSNFYSSTMMEAICAGLQAAGTTTLRVNTRGHDGVSTSATDTGGRLCGSAYEIVDDCRHDVSAWVDLLVARGIQRIGLLGHSLGALKILYAQAFQPHPAVRALIAISPPRLSYARFQVCSESASFQSSWKTAKHWMDAGQARMLFLASFPFPLVLSAATYLDKYGPEERYNLLTFANRIEVPVEFVFGEQELMDENPAFAGLTNELATLPWSQPPRIGVIPGANHFYAGCALELVDHVVQATLGATDRTSTDLHGQSPDSIGAP